MHGLVTGGTAGSIILTLPLEHWHTLIEKFICPAGLEHVIIEVFLNGSVRLTAALDVTDVSLVRFAPAPVAL